MAQDIFTLPISFQEVKDRLAENFKGETHVAKVVEAVEHSHAKVLPLRVLWIWNLYGAQFKTSLVGDEEELQFFIDSFLPLRSAFVEH